MRKLLHILLFCSLTTVLLAQHNHNHHHYFHEHKFTEADTLRGMLRPERTCYDVTFYELDLKIDIDKKYISGYVDMHFDIKEDFEKLQVDLFPEMKVKDILLDGKSLDYDRVHNALFVHFPKQYKDNCQQIRIHYAGTPIAAKNAPWDGGFSWKTDDNDKPWIGVSCEGIGASLWWPNKDHLSDEPDSMAINIAVPDDLVCIANGNLRQQKKRKDGYTQYDWFVSYPINNYNVTLNIGDYVHFADSYTASDGEQLALDYYVLSYNLNKAKKHFQQVPEMLACYEHYFDKYPFWEDGYAMVETPYLGMEHQGAIAYGNKYMRGYLGGMIPRDMDWDYIIVHETGHEYWGNSISANDHAEMWIHESFTTYMEALYVECTANYEDAVRYLMSQRPFIGNKEPIVGPLDVNFEDWKQSDHYYKGSWVLHTLRHAIYDDELWFKILKSFYQKNAFSNIVTADFVDYVNEQTGKNYTPFFEQYLYRPLKPTLLYSLTQKGKDLEIVCQWEAQVDGFDMPVLVGDKAAYQMIYPNQKQQTFTLKDVDLGNFDVATELFYIDKKEVVN